MIASPLWERWRLCRRRGLKKVGSTVHEYEYSGGKLFYEKRGDTQFYYRYDALGNLATITRIKADGEIFNGYVICNSRGDVEEIRYASGEPYARYVYDSWGNTIAVYDANGQPVTSETHLAVQNPIRYRGYYWDSETKLYYLQSRYYDPVVGRFLNADEYVSTGQGVLGSNMFAYCNNNPVMYTDSVGMAPMWWQWTISGLMVTAGVALVATGVGGIAGGSLICAGANSILGSYVSESSGGTSIAGWAGGMISGAISGIGAGIAGNLLVSATNMTGVACLGTVISSEAVSLGSGALGATVGSLTTAQIDNKRLSKQDITRTATIGGTVNMVAGLASGIGTGIATMPSISQTSKIIANCITTGWNLISEAVNDAINTIASWFS